MARADEAGPVSLVGWSLGGVVVREVARRRPDLVSQVVTFGTPLVGGTTHTAGARISSTRTRGGWRRTSTGASASTRCWSR